MVRLRQSSSFLPGFSDFTDSLICKIKYDKSYYSITRPTYKTKAINDTVILTELSKDSSLESLLRSFLQLLIELGHLSFNFGELIAINSSVRWYIR